MPLGILIAARLVHPLMAGVAMIGALSVAAAGALLRAFWPQAAG